MTHHIPPRRSGEILHLTKEVTIPKELFETHRKGKLVFFVGAGASMPQPTGMPDFWALTERLTNMAGESFSDKRKDYQDADRLLGSLPDKFDIRRHTQNIFIDMQDEVSKTKHASYNKVHEAIIRLAAEGERFRIITTNFDTFLEKASKEVNVNSEKLKDNGTKPLSNFDFDGIVHIHGSIDGDTSDIVITDEHFGKSYMSKGNVRQFVEDILKNHSVLFIGYSYNDTMMHYLSRAIRSESTMQHYIFLPKGAVKSYRHWELLRLTPINYPISYDAAGNQDHSELPRALYAWYELMRRYDKSASKRIKYLTTRNPKDISPIDSTYLVRQLNEYKEAVKEFIKGIYDLTDELRVQQWVEWIQGRASVSHTAAESIRDSVTADLLNSVYSKLGAKRANNGSLWILSEKHDEHNHPNHKSVNPRSVESKLDGLQMAIFPLLKSEPRLPSLDEIQGAAGRTGDWNYDYDEIIFQGSSEDIRSLCDEAQNDPDIKSNDVLVTLINSISSFAKLSRYFSEETKNIHVSNETNQSLLKLVQLLQQHIAEGNSCGSIPRNSNGLPPSSSDLELLVETAIVKLQTTDSQMIEHLQDCSRNELGIGMGYDTDANDLLNRSQIECETSNVSQDPSTRNENEVSDNLKAELLWGNAPRYVARRKEGVIFPDHAVRDWIGNILACKKSVPLEDWYSLTYLFQKRNPLVQERIISSLAQKTAEFYSCDPTFTREVILPLFSNASTASLSWSSYFNGRDRNGAKTEMTLELEKSDSFILAAIASWKILGSPDLSDSATTHLVDETPYLISTLDSGAENQVTLLNLTVTASDGKYAESFATATLNFLTPQDDDDQLVNWNNWIKSHVDRRMNGIPRDASDKEIHVWIQIALNIFGSSPSLSRTKEVYNLVSKYPRVIPLFLQDRTVELIDDMEAQLADDILRNLNHPHKSIPERALWADLVLQLPKEKADRVVSSFDQRDSKAPPLIYPYDASQQQIPESSDSPFKSRKVLKFYIARISNTDLPCYGGSLGLRTLVAEFRNSPVPDAVDRLKNAIENKGLPYEE
jgi:hypothetical protein